MVLSAFPDMMDQSFPHSPFWVSSFLAVLLKYNHLSHPYSTTAFSLFHSYRYLIAPVWTHGHTDGGSTPSWDLQDELMLIQNKAIKVLYCSLETVSISWQCIYALALQGFSISIIDVSEIFSNLILKTWISSDNHWLNVSSLWALEHAALAFKTMLHCSMLYNSEQICHYIVKKCVHNWLKLTRNSFLVNATSPVFFCFFAVTC